MQRSQQVVGSVSAPHVKAGLDSKASNTQNSCCGRTATVQRSHLACPIPQAHCCSAGAGLRVFMSIIARSTKGGEGGLARVAALPSCPAVKGQRVQQQDQAARCVEGAACTTLQHGPPHPPIPHAGTQQRTVVDCGGGGAGAAERLLVPLNVLQLDGRTDRVIASLVESTSN